MLRLCVLPAFFVAAFKIATGTAECTKNCFGETCNFWVQEWGTVTLADMEAHYGCDCSGCGSNIAPTQPSFKIKKPSFNAKHLVIDKKDRRTGQADDCTGYCTTSCAAFEYCLTAPDANCANAPQDCETRCTSCVGTVTRRRRRRSSSLNASSVNYSSSITAHEASVSFDFIDTDKSGWIDVVELRAALYSGEAHEAEEYFKAFDSNHDGKVSRAEFVNAVAASSVNASSSLNASDDCTGYCATSCAAFEYCLTAPDANCANAPQDCETRCASCVQGCSYADVIKSCEEQRGAYAWTCSRIQVQSKVCASCELEVENLESEVQRLRALLGLATPRVPTWSPTAVPASMFPGI